LALQVQTKQIVQKLEGHTDTVVGVSVHPRLNMIASSALAGDATIRIWVDESAQVGACHVLGIGHRV
jgi:COMPASS component SWD3